MTLVVILIIGVIVVIVLTLYMIAYINQHRNNDHLASGPDPSTIDLKPEYARCTIRAEHANRPPKSWHNVRIEFFLVNGKQPVRQLCFDEWSRDSLIAFEDRLVELGFMRTASGSSDQLNVGFDRMQRFVIFLRDEDDK